VDVVLLRDLTPEGSTRNFVSQVVIQNIRVLGVDLNADLASNKPATPNTATLEVSVPDAQKLAVAADLGKLSLALRKSGSTEIEKTEPMRTASFVGGAPRATHGFVRRAAAPAAPQGPSLIVIVEGGPNGAGKHRDRRPAAPPPPALPVPSASSAADKANAASLASSAHPA
jgi:pilus assembly protein CpaB